MKSKFLFLTITLFLGLIAKSQPTYYYHVHDGHFYLVTAADGIDYQGNDVILNGAISETNIGNPDGFGDPDIAVPECNSVQNTGNQSKSCGPYATRSGGTNVIIESCGNTNTKLCQLRISQPNGSILIITYSGS